MRSSRVSLRPATTQRVGVRHAGQHVGLADLPAAGRGHGVGETAGQLGDALAGLGQEVQHAELGEHDLVPVGAGPDDAGQAADPVGQGAGAGVDEAGREVVPRRVAGQRRVGETGAQPVVEPAVELDEAGQQPGDALVALAARGRAAASGAGSGSASASSPGGAPRAAWPGPVGPAAASRRACPSTQARVPGVATAAGTWPLTHIRSRARACLHGCDRLGHVHRHARWAWSTIVSYGSRPDPRQRPHAASLVGPEGDPARRRGDGIGRGEPRRVTGRSPPPARSTTPSRPTLARGCHGGRASLRTFGPGRWSTAGTGVRPVPRTVACAQGGWKRLWRWVEVARSDGFASGCRSCRRWHDLRPDRCQPAPSNFSVDSCPLSGQDVTENRSDPEHDPVHHLLQELFQPHRAPRPCAAPAGRRRGSWPTGPDRRSTRP